MVSQPPRERLHERTDMPPASVNAWAVTVRLNDGSVLFWCGEETERQGQPWSRESQAFRFANQEGAERYAAHCVTNSKAWEYRAVPLARPGSGNALTCRGQ